MRWERELGDALRELARSADEVPENPQTERRLLEAFDGRRGASLTGLGSEDRLGGGAEDRLGRGSENRPGRGSEDPRYGEGESGSRFWYLAAAASIVLAVGAWWGAAQLRQPVRTTAAEPGATVAVAAPTAPQYVPPQPSEASPATAAAVAPRAPRSETTARPAPRPIPTAASAAEVVDDADEFVTLPAADRLPGLESGMIVRVELPATSLPAYGFPIMPDSTLRPVTADVLVGQDGQPRAIRLVNMQSGTRRRQ
jgi:hypothetical protein